MHTNRIIPNFYSNRYVSLLASILCWLLTLAALINTPDCRAALSKSYLPDSTVLINTLKKADAYINANRADSALLILSEIAEFGRTRTLHREDAERYCRIHILLGRLFITNFGDYPRAVDNFLKASELAEEYDCKPLKRRIEYNLSALAYEQGILVEKDSIPFKAMEAFSIKFNECLRERDFDLIKPSLESMLEIRSINGLGNQWNQDFSLAVTIDSLPDFLRQISQAALFDSEGNTSRGIAILDSIRKVSREEPGRLSKRETTSLDILYAGMIARINPSYGRWLYDSIANAVERHGDLFLAYELKGAASRLTTSSDTLQSQFELLQSLLKILQHNRLQSLDGSRTIFQSEKVRQHSIQLENKMTSYQSLLIVSAVFILIIGGLCIVLWRNNCQLAADRNIIVKKDKELFSLDRPNESVTSTPTDEESVFAKVNRILTSTDEVYNEEFGVARLAELAKEKPSTISAAVKEATGEGVSALIMHVRIREACRRMADVKNYSKYTVEAFGQSVGYSSRSHFGNIFKKEVGLSPSDYIRKIRSLQNQSEKL